MESDTLETAVMKRKRKRTFAVDPCLGFYAIPPPKPPIFHEPLASPVVERQEATSMDLDLPKWTVMEEPRDNSDTFDVSSEDNVQLTVEKFLQRGAENARPIRKYGRRYRNRRVIHSSRSPSDDEGQDPETDSGQSNRRTLRFVSVNHKSAVSRPKARPMRFWTSNKRRGVPFRASSFSEKRISKPCSTEVATPQHPLSRWNTFKTPRSQTDSSRPSAEIPSHKKCTPLNFVPLAIAEKAYKKKKNSPKSTRNPESTPSVVAPLAFATTFTTPTLSAMPALHTLTSATISFKTHPVISELLPSTTADTPLATEREDQESSSPDLGFKIMSASSKCLKPLGSFLDGFMERVRAATQADNVQAMARHDQLQLESPTISVGQDASHLDYVNKKLSPSGSDTSFGSAAHHKILSNACFDDSFLDFDEDDTFSDLKPLHQVPLNINAALMAYSQAGEVRFA